MRILEEKREKKKWLVGINKSKWRVTELYKEKSIKESNDDHSFFLDKVMMRLFLEYFTMQKLIFFPLVDTKLQQNSENSRLFRH